MLDRLDNLSLDWFKRDRGLLEILRIDLYREKVILLTVDRMYPEHDQVQGYLYHSLVKRVISMHKDEITTMRSP